MTFDDATDRDQLALIKEQHSIVCDLREAGYLLDFLFVPPDRCLNSQAIDVLTRHLGRPYSNETLRQIRELLAARSPRGALESARASRDSRP